MGEIDLRGRVGVGINQVSHNMSLTIQSHAMENATVLGIKSGSLRTRTKLDETTHPTIFYLQLCDELSVFDDDLSSSILAPEYLLSLGARGIPPQIIVIYTTMSPILLIFGPKVPPQVVFKNPKNFWPRTPRGRDMAI